MSDTITASPPKETKAPKVETEKKAAPEAAKSADTPKTEKADAAPKSASQTSISHFSSVSTPAYKEGWESIFGKSNKGGKKTSKKNDTEDFPEKLTIDDDEIDKELRAALYKAFQKKARKQGVSLAKLKKRVSIEYSLECHLSED